MSRAIFATLLLLVSSAATAQVLDANVYKPMPGKGPLTFQYGQEARAIQQELGATVLISQDVEGRMIYVLSHENWTAWAKFGAKLQASEKWSAFLAKINAAPSAELEDHYMLDTAAPGAGGAVFQVFVWEPELGRGADLAQGGLAAKTIHEKAGASVGVLFDQLGRMHYVMAFESWEAWGKFADTPNPEFQQFMAEQSKNPNAKLVKVYTGSTM